MSEPRTQEDKCPHCGEAVPRFWPHYVLPNGGRYYFDIETERELSVAEMTRGMRRG